MDCSPQFAPSIQPESRNRPLLPLLLDRDVSAYFRSFRNSRIDLSSFLSQNNLHI
jgi:hypothetical protein